MASWKDSASESEARQIVAWLFTEALKDGPKGEVLLPRAFMEPENSAAFLSGRLRVNKGVSRRRAYHLARRAAVDAFKAGNRTVDGFLLAFSALESAFLRKPLRPFVLLTSINDAALHDLATVRLRGATITFSKSPPARFAAHEEAQRHRWHSARFKSRTTVRVHVREREASDAGEAALDHLELLRAYWNWALHRGTWSLRWGEPRPINRLRLGPIHTVHRPTGEVAHGTFWYEPDFDERETVSPLRGQEKEHLKSEERWLRGQIARLRCREAVEGLFVRYCRALDQRSPSNAFLHTWGLLEDLTGNPRSYDDLITRASYLYNERWYVRLHLAEMRDLRNEFVHQGTVENERFERLVYSLKGIVEHYILLLLRHPSRFRSLSELGAFLSQPTDVKALRSREEGARFAREILSEAGR